MSEVTSQRVEIRVGGATMPIDLLDMSAAIDQIDNATAAPWTYVVTPNAQHLSLLLEEPELQGLYDDAVISLADGWPVALLAGWRAKRRVARVSGSDVLEVFINRPGRGRTITFIGGAGGEHFEALAERCISTGWIPSHEPAPRAELESLSKRRDLLERVRRASEGGVVVIGVGAPKQELLARELIDGPGDGVALCLGMAINFSAGAIRRAPSVIQKLGLEWLHRAFSEPRRLFPRYVRNGNSLLRIAKGNVVR